jgi:hypothetical protein
MKDLTDCLLLVEIKKTLQHFVAAFLIYTLNAGLNHKLAPLNFSNVVRKKALYGAEKALIGAPYNNYI